jgi:transposase
MLIIPSSVKIYLALGHTYTRKGFDSLGRPGAGSAQEGSLLGSFVCLPQQEGGHDENSVLGRQRVCLFTKRLREGRFIWPSLCESSGTVTLTPAQLAMLIEGIDWRTPERTWKPSLAG